jgi:imidazolonepropionase-like amidohydrolase
MTDGNSALPVAIRTDGIFDGCRWQSGPVLIIVRGGVIAAIDRTGATPPAGLPVHHYPGATVMPGLIDAHTHLAFSASAGPVAGLAGKSDSAIIRMMRKHARSALVAGVTSLRDLGDFNFLTLVLRDEYANRPAAGPHVVAAGPPITRADGHCAFLGCHADTSGEIATRIAEHASRGTDLIKIMATGGMGADPTSPQYTAAGLAVAVNAARESGLPITAHAHASASIADAVAAGVTGIEHCTFLTPTGIVRDDRLIDTLAERNIFVGATVARPRSGMPPSVLETLEPYWANHTHMLLDRGVPVVCCTDAGINSAKPHSILPSDIAYFATHVGTTAALSSATATAAHACGLGGRKGTLRPGYDADLLILPANPTSDVAALLTPAAVYRLGHLMTRTQPTAL